MILAQRGVNPVSRRLFLPFATLTPPTCHSQLSSGLSALSPVIPVNVRAPSEVSVVLITDRTPIFPIQARDPDPVC